MGLCLVGLFWGTLLCVVMLCDRSSVLVVFILLFCAWGVGVV